jgi:hypothetical protein
MSLQTRLQDLITAVATDYKQLRVFITGSSTGDLTGLTTTNKNSVVSAINEVNGKAAPAPAAATTTSPGIVQIATLPETATGADTTKVVTVAGVRQERAALKAEILGSSVPSALDTLDELAAAIADDANYAAATATSLGNRLRVDIATQGLTAAQQLNGRTNLDVYSKAEIGNPETDLVALYTTAKA